MKWLNTLRRWFGLSEHPPAVSGATSVLFVLQSSILPMSKAQISAETTIVGSDLEDILCALEQEGRVAVTRGYDGNVKLYAAANCRAKKE